ncbi:hypothetical protein D3C87_1846880 [compost metagenome]
MQLATGSITPAKKLIPPAGAKKLPGGLADSVMNWRPMTMWRGSASVAGPMVPVMRPVMKSGDW